MYSELEAAHFFLPLLSPDMEGHHRYLDGETTGSRQLILGFLKIPVIHEQFAAVYGFNSENALLYADLSLADGMLWALELDSEDYLNRVMALNQLRSQVYAESLDNLRQAVKGIDGQSDN
jgi:hypothetical protein